MTEEKNLTFLIKMQQKSSGCSIKIARTLELRTQTMFACIFGSVNRRRVEEEIAKNLDNKNATITVKVV